MRREQAWSIEIIFVEEQDKTRADAILVSDQHRYHGWGRAKRDPADPDIPRIGEEVAAARALNDLAHQLLHSAMTELEDRLGRAVTVHG
jgi:hypothetical protein